MASPAAASHPQDPASQQARNVRMIDSRDNVTILLLLVIAMFSQLSPYFSSPPVYHAGDFASSATLSDTMFHTLINGPAVPPVAVLCITSCDGQFVLNIVLEVLTLGIAGIFHAIWVILYYGKGGRLTWGQRKKLERQKPAGLLEFPADPPPPHVRNEADANAPVYSSYAGGHGGDSKFV